MHLPVVESGTLMVIKTFVITLIVISLICILRVPKKKSRALLFVRVLINMHFFAVVEMANRVEASTCMWRRRAHSRHLTSLYRSTGARPSWEDDSGRDDESESNTFDWSDKRSSSQLKSSQERERESIIPKG